MSQIQKDRQILTDLLSMYKRNNKDLAFRSFAENPKSFKQDVYERELTERVVQEYSGTLLPEDQVPERQHQYLAFLREMVPSVRRDDYSERNYKTVVAGIVGLLGGAVVGAATGLMAAGLSMWILYAGAAGSVGGAATGAKAVYELLSKPERKIFDHHLRALQRIDARQLDDTVYVSQALFDAALALESNDPKLIGDARESIGEALRVYYPQLGKRGALSAEVTSEVPQLEYER